MLVLYNFLKFLLVINMPSTIRLNAIHNGMEMNQICRMDTSRPSDYIEALHLKIVQHDVFCVTKINFT